jgi:predicted dehydrogenase
VGLLGVLGERPWVVFEVSNRHREKRREVRLHCRDGVAVLPDADAGRIVLTRSDASGRAAVEERPFDPEPALRRELRAFCAHCAGGPPPPTTAAEGLRIVEALVALRGLAGLAETSPA